MSGLEAVPRAFWQGVCVQRAKACEALMLVGQTHVDDRTLLVDYAADLRRWAISPDGLVVIVCGGREWAERVDAQGNERPTWEAERKALVVALDEPHAARTIDLLIDGGARGADRLARLWAQKRGVMNETVKAEWTTYGRAAGPRRNAQMMELLLTYPRRLVVATAGGAGTADMVARAEVAGVQVQGVRL